MNILVQAPDPTDPTSFYRSWGPMTMLQKSRPDIKLVECHQLSWHSAFEMDIALLQRPLANDHVQYAHILKKCGVKIWLDYDDNYLKPQMSNPRYGTKTEKLFNDNIKMLCEMADVITVTTSELRTSYSEVVDPTKIRIIPNACDDRMQKMYGVSEWTPQNILYCRGTHVDLINWLEYGESLQKVYNDTGYNFMFLGFSPFTVTDKWDEKRWQFQPPIDVIDYFKFNQALRPAMVFKPMVDNAFNRARSNITWIEATMCGAVCVAPNFEQWSEAPGCITYTDKKSAAQKMISTLSNKETMKSKWEKASKYIIDNLMLSKINVERDILIDNLQRS